MIPISVTTSGDTVANTEAAKRYSRYAVDQSAIPLAPHLLLPLYMKEETERELAMFMDMVFLGKADQLWVFGDEALQQTALAMLRTATIPIR